MTDILLIILAVLLVTLIILQIAAMRRKQAVDLSGFEQSLISVEKASERVERTVREEISRNRDEASAASKDSRTELSGALKEVGDSLNRQIVSLTQSNDERLDRTRETIATHLQSMQDINIKLASDARTESTTNSGSLRTELADSMKNFSQAIIASVAAMGDLQKTQLESFGNQLVLLRTDNDKRLSQMAVESADSVKGARESVTSSLKEFNESVANRINDLSTIQKDQLVRMGVQLGELTTTNQQKLDALKIAVEDKLKSLQEDNAKQLEMMRTTVDEKLQGTLEKRLGESFKQVSDRLEKVHQGLGEMQALATGVGDLKKVLSNVKSRGTWGEVQLGALLEQVLSPEQYAANVSPKGNGERVEFAIKLPGRSIDADEVVWLPIDAKFPVEDYSRLADAQEKGDLAAAETAANQLEVRVKECAKDICDKYLHPPATTDFGILFLPTEGLFAEVIRRKALLEYIQRECRVIIAGPTTLWALLNSLQMGFKTLTIQKRSSEVWNLLAAVKSEWSKYGDILKAVKTKLIGVTNTIEDAERRTRVIGRKLKNVQDLPISSTEELLALGASADDGATPE